MSDHEPKQPGNSDGDKPRKRRRKKPSTTSNRPSSRGGKPRSGGPGGRPPHGGRGNQTPPIEIVVRSTRGAIRRHAESVRNEQNSLACRSMLVAVHGVTSDSRNPAEVLVMIEHLQHALHTVKREDSQLPVALRAVVAFAQEAPARQRDTQEMLRLLLRHLYALNADYMPRQSRDDARFRTSSVLGLLEEIANEYMDQQRFEKVRGAGL